MREPPKLAATVDDPQPAAQDERGAPKAPAALDAAPARPDAVKSRLLPHRYAIVTLSLLLGLAVWEIVGRWIVTDRLFFVPFSDVAESLWELVVSGELWPNLYVSGLEFTLGLGASIIVGIGVGAAMASSWWLDLLGEPWVSGLYATPLVALTPFFVLVFGIGIASKVALVFALAVFPVLIATRAGILAVDPAHIEVVKSFGPTRRHLYREVLLPSALPYIVTGIRLAVGKALIGVVIGEIFFAKEGVGFIIALASQTFDLARLFAGVLIFAIAGVVLTAALKSLERRIAPWRTEVME